MRDAIRELRARGRSAAGRALPRAKRERDALDFGDQVALAARLARRAGGRRGRAGRFRAVLLDEYQDTSHAQLSMLRALFGARPRVTAVGDPHQSIYGWRGAAPARWPVPRPVRDADGRPPVLHLSTSWRNDAAVLAVANRVAAPLRPAPSCRSTALPARPGAGPRARRGRSRSPTLEEEADGCRGLGRERRWAASGRRLGRTAAVLCRKRSQFALLEEALRARGLPVEVVGLGGLLHAPEVADLLAAAAGPARPDPWRPAGAAAGRARRAAGPA